MLCRVRQCHWNKSKKEFLHIPRSKSSEKEESRFSFGISNSLKYSFYDKKVNLALHTVLLAVRIAQYAKCWLVLKKNQTTPNQTLGTYTYLVRLSFADIKNFNCQILFYKQSNLLPTIVNRLKSSINPFLIRLKPTELCKAIILLLPLRVEVFWTVNTKALMIF